MSEEKKHIKQNSLRQLGVILNPKNLLRTVAASFPGASSVLEIQDQIEGDKVVQRISKLEDTDTELQAKLLNFERAQPKPHLDLHDWPAAVGNYSRRIVDISVVYDANSHSKSQRHRELSLSVAHGCIVGPKSVLTCAEALQLAHSVADHKKGRVTIIAGYALYEFQAEKLDPFSGLVVCELTKRDEDRWTKTKQKFQTLNIGNIISEPPETPVEFSVMPWMGQEIGFLHTGEATNVSRLDGLLSKLQFDTTVISHFRNVQSDTLKSFVTSVLPGRFLHVGSPVFTRTGTLVGVISDTENYPSDAGRRAIVKSLLGHPRFTKWKGEPVKS